MYEYIIYLDKGFGYEYEKTTTNELEIDDYIRMRDKYFSSLFVFKHDIQKNTQIPYVVKFFDSLDIHKKRCR